MDMRSPPILRKSAPSSPPPPHPRRWLVHPGHGRARVHPLGLLLSPLLVFLARPPVRNAMPREGGSRQKGTPASAPSPLPWASPVGTGRSSARSLVWEATHAPLIQARSGGEGPKGHARARACVCVAFWKRCDAMRGEAASVARSIHPEIPTLASIRSPLSPTGSFQYARCSCPMVGHSEKSRCAPSTIAPTCSFTTFGESAALTHRARERTQRRPPSVLGPWISTTHRTVGFGLGPVELLRSCQPTRRTFCSPFSCLRTVAGPRSHSPAEFPGRPRLYFQVCVWAVSHTQGDGVPGACGRHATRQILPSFGLGLPLQRLACFRSSSSWPPTGR